jgi:hypothetical protein
MEAKDIIAIGGIGATFLVSAAALLHSLLSDRRTSFINTVTTSRLKWIDSLRDQVSEFLAVTGRLTDSELLGDGARALLLQRDTLLHQIVLHLNPHDAEDQKISSLVEQVRTITERGNPANELEAKLLELRNATAAYLKKEWNRVKDESTGKHP